MDNTTKKIGIKYILNFISKVFLYSVMLILMFIFAIVLLYFVDVIRNINSNNPKKPLFSAYIVITPSMVPTIKVQDAIIVKRKEMDELKVGDIITFSSTDARYSGLTITHRIVNKTKTESGKIVFRTKGDANNTEDNALVTEENLFGKVILRIPKLGYIQYILSQFYGWVLIIIIPSIGIIIYDFVKLIKSAVKKKQKKLNSTNVNSDLIDNLEVSKNVEVLDIDKNKDDTVSNANLPKEEVDVLDDDKSEDDII